MDLLWTRRERDEFHEKKSAMSLTKRDEYHEESAMNLTKKARWISRKKRDESHEKSAMNLTNKARWISRGSAMNLTKTRNVYREKATWYLKATEIPTMDIAVRILQVKQKLNVRNPNYLVRLGNFLNKCSLSISNVHDWRLKLPSHLIHNRNMTNYDLGERRGEGS